MEKLMKPAEYAKELGISRQAVYAKIKRGILTAKDVEGKLYIVVDTDASSEAKPQESETKRPASNSAAAKKQPTATTSRTQKDYEALLAAKDETISVLKGTVKDLKKSNKQISSTLRSEIDLLKEAFHEMRTLYMHQLEYKKPSTEAIDVLTEEVESASESQWVSVKKLFKALGVEKKKAQEKMLKRLKKAWKEGDTRIMRTENGKLRLDASQDFTDFVK
jgi:septal ring factor EnvC (AmiA/AmiB activator)